MYARRRVKNPKALATILAGLVFCAGVIILFTMGGVFFAKENPRVKYYANTMCQVDGRSYKIYQCKTRYSYYTCYSPIWYAHFQLENQTINTVVEQDQRYSSYSETIDKANEYKINGIYSCWYDTRDPTVSQWDKPSTMVAIILLSFGALCVLLTVLFFFLTYRFVQEKKLQMQVEAIPQYEHPPAYRSVFDKH